MRIVSCKNVMEDAGPMNILERVGLVLRASVCARIYTNLFCWYPSVPLVGSFVFRSSFFYVLSQHLCLFSVER